MWWLSGMCFHHLQTRTYSACMHVIAHEYIHPMYVKEIYPVALHEGHVKCSRKNTCVIRQLLNCTDPCCHWSIFILWRPRHPIGVCALTFRVNVACGGEYKESVCPVVPQQKHQST